MPPTQAIQTERMVKRVDNAIHNPAIDYKGVKAALADLKAASIRPYRQDYDHWVQLAINSGDERKLCCLFGSIKTSALRHLLKNSPDKYLPLYMKSPMFNPRRSVIKDTEDILHEIYDFEQGSDRRLTLFFQQPKSWPVFKAVGSQRQFKKYFKVNPIAQRRKQQRLVLMRFWLLTTKPLLKSWRESLYAPGTGALYKKAAASFEANA